ncbi:Uncharacterised protein [Bordetella pertussis]|nr:Uncharacterised protein [Bordetella pertussis]
MRQALGVAGKARVLRQLRGAQRVGQRRSTTGRPTRVAGPSASPLTLISPHMAWAQAS